MNNISNNFNPPKEDIDTLINLYQNGRLQDVLDKSEQMVLKYSYSFFLYNLRGSANALLKRFDAAVECYKNAIRSNPNYAAVYNNLGNVFKETGELELAINNCTADNTVGDIGHAVEDYIVEKGYGLVRNYTGHGIGKALHEPPQVPNFGKPGYGVKLRSGMTLAIEPMVNLGSDETKLCDDGWTVVTSDGAKSAHFENTVLITDGKPELLTV